MKKTRPYLFHQRGYLVLLLAILIVIVGFIAAASVNMFYAGTMSTNLHYQSDAALYLAEAGLEHATHKLLEPTVANRSTCVGYSTTPLTNTLGGGGYSVTSSGAPIFIGIPTAAATLTSAITATSTSIPVSSTTGYGATGRIMIDGESINYEGTTSTSFLYIIRGADGTTAVAHASGTAVGQYQCTLTSQAGVPSIAAAQGLRVLQDNVQLAQAWAAGDASSSGVFTFGVFNYPTEDSWYNVGGSGGVNVYGNYMISYVDGWFVGANFLEHWNGTTGTVFTAPVNVSYRSVFCISKNDCHAVGDNTGTLSINPVIIRWTGSSWAQLTPTGNGKGNGLKSVNCDSTADCWAVGDIGTGSLSQGYRFYHWAGSSWIGITLSATALTAAFPFMGVFCNSATDCWAVGSTNNFGRLTSGTTWTAYATGLPNVVYNSIFCNGTNDCWAVGNVSTTNLFVHWNGTAWSRDSSAPTPLTNLNGVSCVNANDCWAVGSSNSGNLPQYFHWDGTSWTNFANVSNGAFPSATLRTVSVVGVPVSQPMTGWAENFP